MNRQQLIDQIHQKGSYLCVGLDTDPLRLPNCLKGNPDATFEFNRAVIDATAPYCVAYKPNTAFYEAQGLKGWEALARTIDYIRAAHPHHFIIADGKRGDIGNTSGLYARAFFGELGVDALTVAPYMGSDSVKPFLDYEGKWTILLALTSNPGSRDFQFFTNRESTRLFEEVMTQARTWAGQEADEKLMFVVGATRREMFIDVRRLAPRAFLLVPGIGAQGGSLDDVVRYGKISDGSPDVGLLVNASRSVIFASPEPDFAQTAAREAAALAAQMAKTL